MSKVVIWSLIYFIYENFVLTRFSYKLTSRSSVRFHHQILVTLRVEISHRDKKFNWDKTCPHLNLEEFSCKTMPFNISFGNRSSQPEEESKHDLSSLNLLESLFGVHRLRNPSSHFNKIDETLPKKKLSFKQKQIFPNC